MLLNSVGRRRTGAQALVSNVFAGWGEEKTCPSRAWISFSDSVKRRSFGKWDQLMSEMGCAPSKSAVVYGEDSIFRDWDTCSTFVPSPPCFVSTLEKPRWSDESGSLCQTLSNGECPLQIHTLVFYLCCIKTRITLLTSFFFFYLFLFWL